MEGERIEKIIETTSEERAMEIMAEEGTICICIPKGLYDVLSMAAETVDMTPGLFITVLLTAAFDMLFKDTKCRKKLIKTMMRVSPKEVEFIPLQDDQ